MNNGNGGLKKREKREERMEVVSRWVTIILVLIIVPTALTFVAKVIWTFSAWIWNLW